MFVHNVLDEGKIFVCGKLPWLEISICVWKSSLLKENLLDEGKYVFVENLLDEEKIFTCGKLPQ